MSHLPAGATHIRGEAKSVFHTLNHDKERKRAELRAIEARELEAAEAAAREKARAASREAAAASKEDAEVKSMQKMLAANGIHAASLPGLTAMARSIASSGARGGAHTQTSSTPGGVLTAEHSSREADRSASRGRPKSASPTPGANERHLVNLSDMPSEELREQLELGQQLLAKHGFQAGKLPPSQYGGSVAAPTEDNPFRRMRRVKVHGDPSRSPSPRRTSSVSPRRTTSESPRRDATSPRRSTDVSPRRGSLSPRRSTDVSPRRDSRSPRRSTDVSPRRDVSPRHTLEGLGRQDEILKVVHSKFDSMVSDAEMRSPSQRGPSRELQVEVPAEPTRASASSPVFQLQLPQRQITPVNETPLRDNAVREVEWRETEFAEEVEEAQAEKTFEQVRAEFREADLKAAELRAAALREEVSENIESLTALLEEHGVSKYSVRYYVEALAKADMGSPQRLRASTILEVEKAFGSALNPTEMEIFTGLCSDRPLGRLEEAPWKKQERDDDAMRAAHSLRYAKNPVEEWAQKVISNLPWNQSKQDGEHRQNVSTDNVEPRQSLFSLCGADLCGAVPRSKRESMIW